MISFRNAQEEQEEEEEAEEVCSYLQLLYKQNDGTSMRACLIVEKATCTSICAMATVRACLRSGSWDRLAFTLFNTLITV